MLKIYRDKVPNSEDECKCWYNKTQTEHINTIRHSKQIMNIAGGFVLLSSVLSSSLYCLIDLYPFNAGSVIGKQEMGHVSKIKLFLQCRLTNYV